MPSLPFEPKLDANVVKIGHLDFCHSTEGTIPIERELHFDGVFLWLGLLRVINGNDFLRAHLFAKAIKASRT
jgi:hypothetical protein